jgi:hypothetical protein
VGCPSASFATAARHEGAQPLDQRRRWTTDEPGQVTGGQRERPLPDVAVQRDEEAGRLLIHARLPEDLQALTGETRW